jgi:hypothetical protein
MPHIQTFVTLSPIPGFLQWLLPKLALQSKPPGSNFREELLLPVEEESLKVAYGWGPIYIAQLTSGLHCALWLWA